MQAAEPFNSGPFFAKSLMPKLYRVNCIILAGGSLLTLSYSAVYQFTSEARNPKLIIFSKILAVFGMGWMMGGSPSEYGSEGER